MFIATPPPSEAASRIYSSNAAAQGFVMNLTRAWAWRPEVFEAFAALRTQLTAASTLTKRDQAVLICAMAAQLEDSYCSLAWGKTLAAEIGANLAAAVISGQAPEKLSARDRALALWARKVVVNPNATTQADIDELRSTGLSDREVFEITAFVAFRLAFSTVNDALGAAPDAQLLGNAPPAVADAVDYGRKVASQPSPAS